MRPAPLIDGLQYANWSEKIFRQMREGGVDAVHVTIAYHENFRETVLNFERWNRWFEEFPDLILKGKWASDIDRARDSGKTAIFFGFQNPSPIEDDIGLVEIVHTLGARFMQLTYNNQSLLATGCYEDEDSGLTRMGKQVIREMNRVGLVVDMSHSADRSTIEAAEWSERPITVTHANPHVWHPALRNKRDDVIRAVTQNGGMIGFSLYPHHLKGGSDCDLGDFCQMIARAADRYGVAHLGIGSDLCQDQPDSVVEWMRVGRWSKQIDYGEGSKAAPGFPPMPAWFGDNRDFGNIRAGLCAVGMSPDEVDAVMGGDITGLLRPSVPNGTFLESNNPEIGRWVSRDTKAMSKAVGLGHTLPYFIDAAHDSAPRDWPRGGLTIVKFPNNHVSYAVTWYAMALLFSATLGVIVWREVTLRRDGS